ncbi:MAG: hypothetical protein JWM43_2403 [Acidobacteriaceae bacterium]|nr:hypothetical protein [Acidobacteriaceae bacterium]
MKFELTETVAVANPEEVLRVLEQHLRAVAGDVVRSEGQVTAFGIGPSPRTVNRRDTTVIDAREVDGQTVLFVQVNYQASALLGNMPQDGIVRSKIEGAIDEMRGELKVWKPWGPPPGLDAAAPVDAPQAERPKGELPGTLQEERKFDTGSERWPTPRPEASTQVPEVVVEPILAPPSEKSSETELLRSMEVKTADVPATPTTSEPEPVATRLKIADEKSEATGKPTAETRIVPEIAGQKDSANESEVAQLATPADASTQRSAIRLSKGRRKKHRLYVDSDRQTKEPLTEEGVVKPEEVKPGLKDKPPAPREIPLAGLLRGQDPDQIEEDEIREGGQWKTIFTVLIVMLLALAVGAYFLRDRLPIPEPWKTKVESWTSEVSSQVAGLRMKIAVEKAPEPAPAAQEAPIEKVVTVSDPEVMVKAASNIYLWVQDWASALRSKDPVAQASYYADTVNQYLTNTEVTRDFVQEQKKAAIEAREDLWTMRVEHVYVESQNSAGARLRVVRRVMTKDAAGVTSEHAVKIRLKVVRVGDTWKIVEEQETGPAA